MHFSQSNVEVYKTIYKEFTSLYQCYFFYTTENVSFIQHKKLKKTQKYICYITLSRFLAFNMEKEDIQKCEKHIQTYKHIHKHTEFNHRCTRFLPPS